MENSKISSFPRKRESILSQISILVLAFVVVVLYTYGLRGQINFPREFVIGPVTIHLYALSLLTGIGVVAYLFNREKSKYKELRKVDTLNALAVILVFAIIGARLWHVVTDFYLYQENPIEIFYIWNGGLGIFGGIIGGVFGAWLYSRTVKTDLLLGIALVSVFLPLGQAIGRFGNFFNQELYGASTELPWGIYIRDLGQFYHPTFLYEQIGMAVLFGLMIFLYKKFSLRKELTLVYLAGYSFVRFFVDFYRLEPEVLFGLTVAQVFSIIVFFTCLVILATSFRHSSSRRRE